MSFKLKWFSLALIVLMGLNGPVAVSAQNNPGKSPQEKLWDDFIHYCTIVNIQMATGSGQALLDENLDAETLMGIVENSDTADKAPNSRFAKWYVILQRTRNLSVESADLKEPAAELREVADKIDRMIIDAQYALARDPKRIRAAIEELAGPAEQQIAAMDRLKIAGQFAAPELVKMLRDDSRQAEKLRPWVLDAMEAIGHSVVVPMGEALPYLPPITQQEIATVMGKIRYPVALPYLMMVYNSDKTDGPTKAILKESIDRIASQVAWPTDVTPEYVFQLLAEDYYAKRQSLLLLPEEEWNPLWVADKTGELRFQRIPTPVFYDVMAMRMSWYALSLKADYHQAQSLWIVSNFRRQIALTEAGMSNSDDPSYGNRQSPQFYARLSGSERLQPGLTRALVDRDSALAREVIKALASIAGDSILLNMKTPSNQPLLAALNYPERRVRFEAALAIANARPVTPFFGAQRVVPVLIEATRQDKILNALVISPDQKTRNELTATLNELTSTEPYQATYIDGALELLKDIPTADIMLIRSPRVMVMDAYEKARRDFKLQSTPIVVIATNKDDFHHLQRAFRRHKGVIVVENVVDREQVATSVTNAVKTFRGEELGEEEATEYALQALDALRLIGVGSTKVFTIRDAQSGLVDAMSDEREAVAIKASQVLALVNTQEAQRAIADIALDDTKSEAMRSAAFDSLAKSAARWGAKLSDFQKDQINKLVGELSDDLADAAARAHGALNMPSAKGANLIVNTP